MGSLRHCDPDFERLLTDFRSETLDGHDQSVVGIRPGGEIAYVNPAYFRFAAENGGDRVPIEWSLGANLFEAIRGPQRGFYEDNLGACLTNEEPWSHEYECSSREILRRYHMHAYPLRGAGLLLVHSLVVATPHEASRDPVRHPRVEYYRDGNGLIHQCYYCRRVRRQVDGAGWDWVPDWVETPPPETSGALCETCFEYHFPGITPPRP